MADEPWSLLLDEPLEGRALSAWFSEVTGPDDPRLARLLRALAPWQLLMVASALHAGHRTVNGVPPLRREAWPVLHDRIRAAMHDPLLRRLLPTIAQARLKEHQREACSISTEEAALYASLLFPERPVPEAPWVDWLLVLSAPSKDDLVAEVMFRLSNERCTRILAHVQSPDARGRYARDVPALLDMTVGLMLGDTWHASVPTSIDILVASSGEEGEGLPVLKPLLERDHWPRDVRVAISAAVRLLSEPQASLAVQRSAGGGITAGLLDFRTGTRATFELAAPSASAVAALNAQLAALGCVQLHIGHAHGAGETRLPDATLHELQSVLVWDSMLATRLRGTSGAITTRWQLG